MSVTQKNSIAGMSLGGGRKENFFFCLLEFYESEERWFLTSLKQVNEEVNVNKDEVITSWIESSELKQLVVDFPLSKPTCETCNLQCPGVQNCHHPVVTDIRSEISSIMEFDKELVHSNPKRYEQERREDSLIHYSKSVWDKETEEHILSKSFKRKLKKGFIPYWNRPIDFWIWKNYYDQLLKLFKISFDSFGNVSLMLLHKFHYLLRHLPRDLQIFESSAQIVLIELYRAKVLTRKNLIELQDLNVSTLARVQIAKKIEKNFNIFIYEKDLELITKNSKAFESFLLAVCGHFLVIEKTRNIPDFGESEKTRFIIPSFFENIKSQEGQ